MAKILLNFQKDRSNSLITARIFVTWLRAVAEALPSIICGQGWTRTNNLLLPNTNVFTYRSNYPYGYRFRRIEQIV